MIVLYMNEQLLTRYAQQTTNYAVKPQVLLFFMRALKRNAAFPTLGRIALHKIDFYYAPQRMVHVRFWESVGLRCPISLATGKMVYPLTRSRSVSLAGFFYWGETAPYKRRMNGVITVWRCGRACTCRRSLKLAANVLHLGSTGTPANL